MAQEEHFKEIVDAEKLWTSKGSDRSRNKGYPLCRSGTAQERFRQEISDQRHCSARNPEKNGVKYTLERSGMRKWHKGPRPETAATWQQANKEPNHE
jgi:hypothetical protein